MYTAVSSNWLNHFLDELERSRQVKIISPFISDNIVEHLLSKKGDKDIFVITRYNLNDFRSRVSSLSALRKLVKAGCHVRGVKGLHSKVYLFDNKCTIVSSANFTTGGFFNNYEFGIKSYDLTLITSTINYFNYIFSIDDKDLSLEEIGKWEKVLKNSNVPKVKTDDLPDLGVSPLVKRSNRKRYFIKFFGRYDSRVDLNYSCREMVETSHCHFAVTFSGKKGRPRKYQDNDVVYLARMLHGRDYAIFGKAISIKHDDKRDIASQEDIDQIEWKEDWPIYIRIKNPLFIDGVMADCPKMSELIKDVKYESFDKTNARYLAGEININPWDSLRQQADVQLSEFGAQWLEMHFAKAVENYGSIPDSFIENLYQPVYPV